MKKLVMLLLCGGLLTACSNSSYSVKVSDGDDVLISGGEVSISKQDYFETLMDRYGGQKIIDEALLSIADKELTDQDTLDKLVKEKEETYAKYADNDLEAYAKKMGYDSKDDYIENYIKVEAKKELLQNKYATEHLDDLIKSSQLVSFKKIIVDKESEALTIIKESTTQKAFDKKLKDAGSDGEDAGIVTKNSTLDDNLKAVLEKLSAVDKDGVYSEAIKLSDDTYAVLYIYNTDHKNTDELVKKLTSDSDIQKEIQGKYLKQYNFTVNDNKVKKAIQQISSEYIE